jgi:sulfonate transport system permease protein
LPQAACAGAGALIPRLLPILLLAAWQLLTQSGLVSTRILPTLSAVAKAGFKLALSGELFEHMGISFARAMAGLAVGGVIGFALGLANGLSQASARLLARSLQMIRNVPHLALIPLVILLVRDRREREAVPGGLGVFFLIYQNTYHGVRTVDPGLIEMGRVYGLGRLPAVLAGDPAGRPALDPGRAALCPGFMWLTLIVAETISASSGIGYLTMNAREFLQTDVVVLGILIYAWLGKLADMATAAIERRCLAWHPAFR